MITNTAAVMELAKINHPNSGIYISGKCESNLSGVTLTDGSTLSFTFNDVLTKKTELQNAEPMRLLREERNQKLQETDWTQYRDVSLSNDSDWQTYRQSLRDLPQNFSPIIDIITEDGYPIVKEQTDWPEKPS